MSQELGRIGLETRGRLTIRPPRERELPGLLAYVEQSFQRAQASDAPRETPCCAVLEPPEVLARLMADDGTALFATDRLGAIHGACIMTRTSSPHPEIAAAILQPEYWGADLGPTMGALLMASRVIADPLTLPTFWAVTQKENMQVKIALRRNLDFAQDLDPPEEIKRRCATKRNAAGAWIWRLDPQDLGAALRLVLNLPERSVVVRKDQNGEQTSSIAIRVLHELVQEHNMRAQLAMHLKTLPARASIETAEHRAK